MTYGGYRFTLGEVDLGQGWIPVDEERAHRRRGASRSA